MRIAREKLKVASQTIINFEQKIAARKINKNKGNEMQNSPTWPY
jgi:hypothetical protein